MADASGGAITGSSSRKKNARLPGKSYHAKARAAGSATAIEITVTTMAIHKLVAMAGLMADAGDARYSHALVLHPRGSRSGQNQRRAKDQTASSTIGKMAAVAVTATATPAVMRRVVKIRWAFPQFERG